VSVELPETKEYNLKIIGNKKGDSKPEKAHCLTGAATFNKDEWSTVSLGKGRRDCG